VFRTTCDPELDFYARESDKLCSCLQSCKQEHNLSNRTGSPFRVRSR